jgi:hypothetical protein
MNLPLTTNIGLRPFKQAPPRTPAESDQENLQMAAKIRSGPAGSGMQSPQSLANDGLHGLTQKVEFRHQLGRGITEEHAASLGIDTEE